MIEGDGERSPRDPLIIPDGGMKRRCQPLRRRTNSSVPRAVPGTSQAPPRRSVPGGHLAALVCESFKPFLMCPARNSASLGDSSSGNSRPDIRSPARPGLDLMKDRTFQPDLVDLTHT